MAEETAAAHNVFHMKHLYLKGLSEEWQVIIGTEGINDKEAMIKK